jgi:hypothetical protein
MGEACACQDPVQSVVPTVAGVAGVDLIGVAAGTPAAGSMGGSRRRGPPVLLQRLQISGRAQPHRRNSAAVPPNG